MEKEAKKLALITPEAAALGIPETPTPLMEHMRCPRCGRHLSFRHEGMNYVGLQEFRIKCVSRGEDKPKACGWQTVTQMDSFKHYDTREEVAFEFYYEFRKMKLIYLDMRVLDLKELHARICRETTVLDVPRRVGLPPNATSWYSSERPISGEAAEDNGLGDSTGEAV